MSWWQEFRRAVRGDVTYDERYVNAAPDMRSAAANQFVQWHIGKPMWPDADIRTFERDGYRRSALVFRCVQYLANAAGSAPLALYFENEEGDPQEVKDHPYRELMSRPNLGQGEGAFLSLLTITAVIAGYAVIEKERDRAGRVIGLWVMRPDWLKAIRRPEGRIDWEYEVPGHDPIIKKHEDVIHITYADTLDSRPTGIGPLEVMLRELGIANALTDFVKVFFQNGAIPRYIGIPNLDGVFAKQWEDGEKVNAFRKLFRQVYGGGTDANDIAVFPALKDIKQIGSSFDELAYPELTKHSEAAIAMAFGIPPGLVGAQVGLERNTMNNAAEQRRSFYEDTVASWWARIDDAFTRRLLPEFEWDTRYSLVFDTSNVPAFQDNENEAHERARQDFTSGLVSRHTAQLEAGYKPHGEDVFLVPFSAVQVPVKQVGQPSVTVSLPDSDPEPDSDDDAVRSLKPLSDFAIKMLPRYVKRDGRLYVNEAGHTYSERSAAQTVAIKRRDLMGRLASILEPRVETFLRAQGKRVIAAATDLRAAGQPFETRAIEAYDWFADDEDLLEMMRQWWAEVTEEAFGMTAQELSVDYAFSVSNPYLSEIVDMLGHRIRGINETTRENIERIVRERLIEGTTIPDLAAALEEWIEPTYTNRAATIARTESQVALNTATEYAYAATGQVTYVRLMDGIDCDAPAGSDGLTCGQRNGLVVPLADIQRHIGAEHPNGTLAYAAVLDPLNDDGSIG